MSSLAAFWAVRLLLSDALESLIVADRVQYLREHGVAASGAFPIFDPRDSPRNMLVYGVHEASM